jgi:phospholipase/lecithinase/hemolysin
LELAAGTAAFGSLPGIKYFRLFDVDGLLDRVIASPEEFHLVDVTDRCTIPNVLVHPICDEPNTYLFWDAAHPTTAGHRIVAKAALSLLPPQ